MEAKITGMDGVMPLLERPWKDIHDACVVGGLVKVLSPLECHTARQQRWYRGVCLPGLADWSGESVEWWDEHLKETCKGQKFLKRETICTKNVTLTRLTIVGVGKVKMTGYIEEILHVAMEERNRWPITPPDSDLRK